MKFDDQGTSDLFSEAKPYLKESVILNAGSPYLKESTLVDEETVPIRESLPPAVLAKFEKDLIERPNWSVEANVILLPIFSFERRSNHKDQGAVILSSLPDVRNGKVVTRQLLISTGKREKDGKVIDDARPGAFDMSLLFCLMDFWDEQGRRPDGLIRFGLNQLCQRLKLTDAGKNYEALKTSILRLNRTVIESKNAFFSAEKAEYITASTSILSDAIIATSSSHGGKGACEVKLGRHILQNLMNNFTAKINRQIYQQLEIPFSQRLLALVIYEQQIRNEIGVIDFELMYLAELLPMQGKLYPSTIQNRLKGALTELKEKKIFESEFIKHNGKTVLRLKSLTAQDQTLVGVGMADLFIKMMELVFKSPFEALIGLSEISFKELVEKDYRSTEFRGRKYGWVYHVVSVLGHMLSRGYKAQDKLRLLKMLLSQDENTLEIPLDFTPVDVAFKNILQRASLERAVVERTKRQEEAEIMAETYAADYLSKLSEGELAIYVKRARDSNPIFANFGVESHFMKSAIITFIQEDIKKGKVFDFGSRVQIQNGPENQAQESARIAHQIHESLSQ